MKSEIALLLSFVASTYAHSWAACFDWKMNAGVNNGFRDQDGTCEGYARRFPLGYPLGDGTPATFGREDNAFGMNGWIQPPGDNTPACAKDSFAVRDHSRPARLADAYAPNSFQFSGTRQIPYGKMTSTRAGERMCIRWPAKNHFNNIGDTEIDIWVMRDTGSDVTQGQLQSQGRRVATLQYRNCPVIDRVRNDGGDSDGPGSDLRPCGGCFNLPTDLATGDYLIQWRWRHPTITYVTCGDMRIASTQAPAPAPIPAPAPSRTPAATRTPSAPAPAPAPSPSRPPTNNNNGGGADLSKPVVTYTKDWSNAFSDFGLRIRVSPPAGRSLLNWSITFKFSEEAQLVDFFSARLAAGSVGTAGIGGEYTFTGQEWNSKINAGQSVEFGVKGRLVANNRDGGIVIPTFTVVQGEVSTNLRVASAAGEIETSGAAASVGSSSLQMAAAGFVAVAVAAVAAL